MDIDIDKILEKEKELVAYDGYLPYIIRWLINADYMKTVLQSENYQKIMEKINKARHYSFDEINEEFIEWCEENMEWLNMQPKRIRK